SFIGVALRRFGSRNRNLDRVISRHQFVGNIPPIEAAPTMFAVDWMAVNFGNETSSNREGEHGYSRLLREPEGRAKIRNFFRFRSKRIIAGEPDPTNFCAIGFVLRILPI